MCDPKDFATDEWYRSMAEAEEGSEISAGVPLSPARLKELVEAPKSVSSGKHVTCIDKVDCCMACIRRRKRGQKDKKLVKRGKDGR